MLQRTTINGTRFASIWIGAKLLDWHTRTFELVSHGPSITKDSPYWW